MIAHADGAAAQLLSSRTRTPSNGPIIAPSSHNRGLVKEPEVGGGATGSTGPRYDYGLAHSPTNGRNCP